MSEIKCVCDYGKRETWVNLVLFYSTQVELLCGHCSSGVLRKIYRQFTRAVSKIRRKKITFVGPGTK